MGGRIHRDVDTHMHLGGGDVDTHMHSGGGGRLYPQGHRHTQARALLHVRCNRVSLLHFDSWPIEFEHIQQSQLKLFAGHFGHKYLVNCIQNSTKGLCV